MLEKPALHKCISKRPQHRLLAAILTLSLLFAFAGCRANGNSDTEGQLPNADDLSIVTSFLPIYIFTANLIAGIEGIRLANMAAPETGCLHDYQLLPSDLVKLTAADLFVINGAGMEGFLTDLAERAGELPIIEASQGIELLNSADGTGNPHVWLSVRKAICQVHNISQGLQMASPAHAKAIMANEQAYVARLEQLQARFTAELKQFAGSEIITFHEAFPYLADEYGLTIAAVIEREPGSEPAAAELAATIDLIKDQGIKALFAEPQYSTKVAETIARETGAVIYTLDPVVTGELAAGTYEKVMEKNLQVLLQALQ